MPWGAGQGKPVRARADRCAPFTTEELAFLAEVSSVPLQQALRHLQTAFGNFFAKRAKYPRYKSRKKSRASAEYTRSDFTWRDGQLTLAKMADPLDIRWSRPLPEGTEPTTVTVSRDAAGRWFVSLLCEDTIAPAAAATTAAVGLDAGITSLVTLSTGEKVANPRHERRDRARLARAQRELSRRRRARRTGRKPAARSPACMRGLPTGAVTCCTSCRLDSSVRTKRS